MGTHPIFESDFDCLTETHNLNMDDSENVERLIFFEQYLFKLKSEKAEYFNEIVERLLSQHLELPFVEDCRKLFVKQKKTKKTGKVFGAHLNNYQLARIQPLVITIRDRIESEGIFRKPGSRARQKELRALLDKGEDLPSIINVNDAGDLLKAFLRELPQPLLPADHFSSHIAITDMLDNDGVSDKRRKMLTLQALLLCLPDVNRRCLRLILSLLYSVARSQDENKMTATSLATVFLPALLPQVLEIGHDPEDRGKMNDHICFLIRHSRKILMPPVEIVHLVQKFYPEVVKNMPPPIRSVGHRRNRQQMRPRSISEMKNSIINFISPAKKKRQQKTRRKELGSISHTLLFRSGSADWTSSPRALNRESRSKSEKVLNRKSRLVDSRDAVSDDGVLNHVEEEEEDYSNTCSIASGISSAKSTDTLELLDMANNVDLFEKDEEQPGPSQMIMTVSAEDEEMDDVNWCDSGETIVRKMTSSASLQCFGDCLDESNVDDPEIHIGSVGDLLKLREQEESQKRQREANRALARTLRVSRENMSTVPSGVRRINSVSKRDEPTPEPEVPKTPEKEAEKENRMSSYDNVASSIGMKRESPTTQTEPKRQKTYHTKEVKTSQISPTVLVKMRGPKPTIKPKPSFSGGSKTTQKSPRSSRRDRLKRNSSTRMGPLAPMAISRSSKETIL